MSSYTIADSQLSIEDLQQLYAEAKQVFLNQFHSEKKKEYLKGYRGKEKLHRAESFPKNADIDFLKSYCPVGFDDLDIIFNVANNNRNTFPKIRMGANTTVQEYLVLWMNGYFHAVANKPSQRVANPKSSCSDPAVRRIVQEIQSWTKVEVENAEQNHNLFMSAENVQGNLLEEYIASQVRPYGYFWCQGNVLRAIDFCNSDGSHFIQIKNKDNSENSSSSNIREGTEITKWFRLGTQHRDGNATPYYNWCALNGHISTHRKAGYDLGSCHMSEESYLDFLKEVASSNRHLITNL